jgi:hypothetical protein
LHDFGAVAQIGRHELAGLLGEVHQDRARLENRDRLAAALRILVDDGRNAVVGRDGEKLRLELLALADVDRDNAVGKPGLLQEHRDLVAVRRRPVVKIDHVGCPSRMDDNRLDRHAQVNRWAIARKQPCPCSDARGAACKSRDAPYALGGIRARASR